MKIIQFVFLFIFVSLYSWLNSTTWHIKQDGTGNFTTIQEGITASTDSDTVLVYPGTYYENIYYNGRNITVASLELITGEEQYISSTIIDGQRFMSTVRLNYGETNTVLRGLTITNGQGNVDLPNVGGGISIVGDSDLLVQCDIVNCHIIGNYGHMSAGIFIWDGDVYLSGNSIRENYSINRGSGLSIFGHSQVSFDPVNRCSIYNNFACTGLEILVESIHFDFLNVIVDTFTVETPTRYFAQHYSNEDFVYSFDIMNHILEPIDHDLFVSPNGNDANSGLSTNDPLKTINLAVRNIASNSTNPRTIHLASGTYNLSENQQLFALSCKSYVNIIGDDLDTTIIDGEYNNYCLLHIGPGFINSLIKNLTFQNSNYLISSIWFSYSDSIRFENIKIQNCSVQGSGAAFKGATSSGRIQLKNVTVDNTESLYSNTAGAEFNGTTSFKASNCTFSNNTSTGSTAFSAGLYAMSSGDISVENCKFFGNSATGTTWLGYASSLMVTDYNDEMGNVFINNCLFYDNIVNFGKSTIYAKVLDDDVLTFSNNTLINNESEYGIEFQGNIEFTNNILRNNGDYEIALLYGPGVTSEINISYSNIEGGQSAVYNQNGVNIINWLEGNIDDDPLFLLSGDDPYQLTSASPCIDTGTLDITGLFLPPWDLLHNYRVWDGNGDEIAVIDMGCYEYASEPYVGVTNDQLPVTDYQLTNYPNPFNPETKIVFDLLESGQIKLEIYNIKGQRVKTLLDCYMSSGRSEMLWNSKDDIGKRVSSGVYFYKLSVNGKTEKTKKMLLLK